MNLLAQPRRQAGLGLLLTLAGVLLTACGSSPVVQRYQLRAEPPTTVAAADAASSSSLAVATNWSLVSVTLPGYLDRDAMVRPAGQSGLTLLSEHRWAEPLRDAVPRILLGDLVRLRGAEHVWAAPVPAGVQVQRQLRIELTQFEAGPDALSVLLQARWWLVDPLGRESAQVHSASFNVPASAGTADALAAAHRAALWQLAQQISRSGS